MSIFVSYRRADSKHATGRIHDWLEKYLPAETVLRDVDALRPGDVPFRRQLQEAIASCDVVLAMIGSNWLSARLSDVNDVLRQELEHALRLGIPIIPVLIDDAELPADGDLPRSLRALLGYQMVRVQSDHTFNDDVLYLVRSIERTLADRRRKAGVSDDVWRTSRHSNKWLRIGAIGALADALVHDSSGAVKERLTELASDPDQDVASYAKQGLALTPAPPDTGPNTGKPSESERALADFKADLREQTASVDSQTHYDLAMAYMEMSLATEAVEEFELAARDSRRAFTCYCMIGLVRTSQGDFAGAEASLLRALQEKPTSFDGSLRAWYDLANVYEQQGKLDDAVQALETIARSAPTFLDTSEWLERLRASGR